MITSKRNRLCVALLAATMLGGCATGRNVPESINMNNEDDLTEIGDHQKVEIDGWIQIRTELVYHIPEAVNNQNDAEDLRNVARSVDEHAEHHQVYREERE